jgi:hypothetical protein
LSAGSASVSLQADADRRCRPVAGHPGHVGGIERAPVGRQAELGSQGERVDADTPLDIAFGELLEASLLRFLVEALSTLSFHAASLMSTPPTFDLPMSHATPSPSQSVIL